MAERLRKGGSIGKMFTIFIALTISGKPLLPQSQAFLIKKPSPVRPLPEVHSFIHSVMNADG